MKRKAVAELKEAAQEMEKGNFRQGSASATIM